MIRVNQTTFGSPGGNCFAACLASLLEMPIDQVPYLMDHDDWFARLQEWLAPMGLYGLMISMGGGHPQGLYILTGRSPRGEHLHSVVARGTTVVHDPHPSRDGVLSHHDAVLLVPLDPQADDPLRRARQVNTLLEGEAATARREAALARAEVVGMVAQLAGALDVPVPGKGSLDPWAELLAKVRGLRGAGR